MPYSTLCRPWKPRCLPSRLVTCTESFCQFKSSPPLVLFLFSWFVGLTFLFGRVSKVFTKNKSARRLASRLEVFCPRVCVQSARLCMPLPRVYDMGCFYPSRSYQCSNVVFPKGGVCAFSFWCAEARNMYPTLIISILTPIRTYSYRHYRFDDTRSASGNISGSEAGLGLCTFIAKCPM